MNVAEKVTVVMTTFNGWDFTHAAVNSIRYFYPDVRIILADGGSPDLPTEKWLMRMVNEGPAVENRDYHGFMPPELISFRGFPVEDCRNGAAFICTTSYVLFCDNDVKCLGPRCIEPMVEVLEQEQNDVQTGAYALKLIDREKMVGMVGKEFDEPLHVDACPAYWSLHRRDAFLKVGGMPKRQCFYPMPANVAEHMERTDLTGYGGDYSISVLYQKRGWGIVTPAERLPVLHWGGRFRFNQGQDTSFEDWWLRESTHIRVEPFTMTNVMLAADKYKRCKG